MIKLGLVLAAISFSSFAEANPSVAFELRLTESPHARSRITTPYYEVNDRDCRDWLAVDIEDARGPEIGGEVAHRDSRTVSRRGLVNGMTFDCASREIRWNGITCATASRTSTWQAIPTIQPTGRCQLGHTEAASVADDGFRTTPVRVIRVTIAATR